MLQVTRSAASTLAGARAQEGLPDHFGVRIFAGATATPDMKSAYQFGFVEAPETSDQVTEAEGTRVFVAPEVADSLENALLDAEEGRLILMPQNKTPQNE
jgi:Fe-S cluster assembly iron-binding protein IscA